MPSTLLHHPQQQDTPAFVRLVLWPLILPLTRKRPDSWRSMNIGIAYLVHVLGMAILGLGLVVIDLTSWDPLIVGVLSGDAFALERALIAGVLIVIPAEVGYLFAAFATMCWGAAREPLSTTFIRSLTRWWQLTPLHATAGLLLIGLVMGAHHVFGYQHEVLRFGLVILLMLGFFLVGLFVTLRWLMFGPSTIVWAVSSDWPLRCARCRYNLTGLSGESGCPECGCAIDESVASMQRGLALWGAACRWPMSCEGCGYALAGLGMDQRCPECGRGVHTSTVAERGGVEHLSPLAALMLGVFRPSRLGGMLPAYRQTFGHGRALGLGVLLLLATGPMSVIYTVVLSALLDTSMLDNAFDLEAIFGIMFGGLYAGIVLASGAVGLGLLAATLVGLGYALFAKRRVMHLAGPAMAYTSGLLTIWALGNAVVMGLTFVVFITSFMVGPQPAWAALLPLAALAGNLGFGVLYIIVLTRVIRATRWANI